MDIKTIHAKGVESLSERQKQVVNRLLNEYYPRIQRQLKNITSFEVDIKKYEKAAPSKGKEKDTNKKRKKGVFVKSGKDKKYSFNIKVVGPAGIFKGDYADWDFTRVIHKVMNKVMNEIEQKMHSSDQHIKIRRPQKIRDRK